MLLPTDERTRLARRAVLATLGGAVLISMIAPHLHARREARFLEVDVNATARAVAGAAVTVHVRGRNTHTNRMRVYPAWVDVSESVGRAGTVTLMNREPARWVPVARSWRLPFVDEIPPGESRDLSFKILGVQPGRYDGFVDVVLNGTSWVRSPVSFEVADPLPAPP